MTVEQEEEDMISDEETEFVTLTAWQNERKEFKDPKTGKLPHPSDFQIPLKFRKTRRHPRGSWGVYERVGKEGHHKVHRRLTSRVKRTEKVQGSDDEMLREHQTDAMFAGASRDTLDKCDDNNMSAAAVLDLLSAKFNEQKEAPKPETTTQDHESSDENHSDNADEAADELVEDSLAARLSIRKTTFNMGKNPQEKATAQAKGKAASTKLQNLKNKFEQKRSATDEGDADGSVRPTKVHKAATASAAEAKKWDDNVELEEIATLEKEAAPLLKRGKGVSQSDRDGWVAIMKAEKEKQKKCNDMHLKMTRKTSSNAFKALAGEALLLRYATLKN